MTGMKEIEKAIELVKKLGAGSVKYVKLTYNPAKDTHYIKVLLLRPIEWRVLSEIVKELEKNFSVKGYAPHARAIRLDLKKR